MERTFTAVTFNILARSLGSSVIPWVLNVSDRAREIVRRSMVNPDLDLKTWLKTVAEPEYKRHFHRNFASGNKECMRSMWSACVERQDDVPIILRSVRCEQPNRLAYPDQPDGESAFPREQSALRFQTATNLKGLLQRDISDVADSLFQELTKDEPVFMWEARGPRIFEIATRDAVLGFFPEERLTVFSDIVTLCEVQKIGRFFVFIF
jgi:hypothetical protein